MGDHLALRLRRFELPTEFPEMEQARSRWRIRYGPEVKPAYKGSLWIDPETARVIRIEMDSKELPSGYDIDKVETVVDYGWVAVGTKKFLLPTRSENLACWRDSFNCTRNEIEFRNYRKFDVESQVLTSDSDISFPEAEEEKGAKKGEVWWDRKNRCTARIEAESDVTVAFAQIATSSRMTWTVEPAAPKK